MRERVSEREGVREGVRERERERERERHTERKRETYRDRARDTDRDRDRHSDNSCMFSLYCYTKHTVCVYCRVAERGEVRVQGRHDGGEEVPGCVRLQRRPPGHVLHQAHRRPQGQHEVPRDRAGRRQVHVRPA